MLKGMGWGGTLWLFGPCVEMPKFYTMFLETESPSQKKKKNPSPRDLEISRTQRNIWQFGFPVLLVVGEGFPGKLGGTHLVKILYLDFL